VRGPVLLVGGHGQVGHRQPADDAVAEGTDHGEAGADVGQDRRAGANQVADAEHSGEERQLRQSKREDGNLPLDAGRVDRGQALLEPGRKLRCDHHGDGHEQGVGDKSDGGGAAAERC
jgi:hypothetical protein